VTNLPPLSSRVIKRDRVASRGDESPRPSASRACADDTPSVSVLRSGEHVRAIVVECPCGRVVELECALEQPAAEGGAR